MIWKHNNYSSILTRSIYGFRNVKSFDNQTFSNEIFQDKWLKFGFKSDRAFHRKALGKDNGNEDWSEPHSSYFEKTPLILSPPPPPPPLSLFLSFSLSLSFSLTLYHCTFFSFYKFGLDHANPLLPILCRSDKKHLFKLHNSRTINLKLEKKM